MKIKCGRREFTLTQRDRILFNGACYILMTQTYHADFHDINPIVSKVLMRKLIKSGSMVKRGKYNKSIDNDGFDLYGLPQGGDL